MPETQTVSSLDSHLGFWLRRVSNAVSQSFARGLEGEGVTVAEWVFLRTLYGEGQSAPSHLADTLAMTKGAITKLADRLIDKSLVARTPDPDDQRAQILALTPRARRLVPRLATLADANDDAFFSCLKPTERAELERLLRKIADVQSIMEIPTR